MRIDGSLLHSRDLYLLLSERLCAGVYSGLDSNSGFKNPVTHPPDGRWVFYLFVIPICIQFLEITSEFPKGAGGEVANARVCKTCIRGFNSRPALQVSIEDHFRTKEMSNHARALRKEFGSMSMPVFRASPANRYFCSTANGHCANLFARHR